MSGYPGNEWNDHAEWWLDEVADDPIYRLDVLPLLLELTEQMPGRLLDLGCGEGQVMALHSNRVVGCDISMDLLRRAATSGPVVRAELPGLDWVRPGSFDGAYMVLVLEHLPSLEIFYAVSTVVRTAGSLALVMNHPAFTSAGSGPIMDQSDGEFLWRWGDYFESAPVRMPTTGADVTFYHRPLAAIVNAAAAAGWCLETIIERGFSTAALAAEPGYVGQEQMPRLLGVRWAKTQGS